ncbi:MAG TPA: imidazole glycerol phosphate synthase subunit HisH [Aquificaceae bacterium]|nr:imidazole glycerol phosphate synthase subunit HisH [Aquificaceae bacterium]
MRTIVIDYGMGNLRSVVKALETVGFLDVSITGNYRKVETADVLVLPGVGAFGDAIKNLEELGLIEPIRKHIEKGKPFLGICLGLQLLFEKSYEHGEHKGLGIFKGEVRLLPTEVKIPHIGWNQVWFKRESEILEGIKEGDFFYFVHSYRVIPKEEEIVLTTTDYGEYFVSSIHVDNLLAVQFHPEKSQKKGLKLLENFRKKAEKSIS